MRPIHLISFGETEMLASHLVFAPLRHVASSGAPKPRLRQSAKASGFRPKWPAPPLTNPPSLRS